MTQLESSSDNDAEYKGGRVLSLYVASVLTVPGTVVGTRPGTSSCNDDGPN